jgi:hypothetical protein
MDAVSWRSIAIVASLQAAVSLVALTSSQAASLAAATIGVLAIGRYFAVAAFAASLGSCSNRTVLRALAGSAWMLCMVALAVALAAVLVKFRSALPWAVAAAFAGPFGMSALAFGSGLRALISSRPAHNGAAHSGGTR